MFRLTLAASLLASGAALAEVPRVSTDILPVHSLVSRVMAGIGSPDLLVDPGASPHGYALRPSQAAALQDADAVIWVSDSLAPWLDGPLDTLAADAVRLELMDVAGTTTHQHRAEAVFEEYDDHAHDEHDNQGHDDPGHDEQGHDEHAHDHSGLDPHGWLDPVNARVWLSAIAETLADIDPENADTYRANADAGRAELAEVIADVEARMAPLADQPFVVFHDAYQYFETRFGLNSAGAISLGDASQPSVARVAEIQAVMVERGVVCVFSEPQFNPGLVATVADGTDARTEVIDPIGQGLESGAAFYPALIEQVTHAFEACLSGA